MNRRDESRDGWMDRSALGVGIRVALAAGMVDVALAMLERPRDLENLTALGPLILAATALVAPLYFGPWPLVRRLTERVGAQRSSAAMGFGSLVLGGFTLALLAGLHAGPLTPHALFRAAIVLAAAAAIGIGTYAAHAALPARHGLHAFSVALGLVAPVVLFEVLVYFWLVIYEIDAVVSIATAVATAALGLVGASTIAIGLRFRQVRSGGRLLVTFVLALAILPALRAGYAERWAAAEASDTRPARAPQQIILITVDTLRADAVSAYSPQASPTTAIDRLAADALVFDRAISTAPWTLPAMASMLTGLSPSVHLVSGITSVLSDRVVTLAESLRERGYRTAAIVHNPLLDPHRNFSQGFDEYLDLHPPSYGNAVGVRLLQRVLPASYPSASGLSTESHAAAVVQWLETNRTKSFFLWVHLFDPHAPYAPSREYIAEKPPPGLGFTFREDKLLATGVLLPAPNARQWIRALYQAEVRGVDAAIDRIIATLKRMNLYDGSLIVLTSDHGEEFWDHGGQGHGHTLFDELLRVPLMIKVPRSERTGRVATAVSTASVTPTLLDLCGIRYDANNLSAETLVPLFTSGQNAKRQPIVSSVTWATEMLADSREAVHFGNLKLMTRQSDGQTALFDIDADPSEQHSMADEAPASLAAGRELLKEHQQQAAALRKRLRIEEGALELDANTLRQLRSLGYVQ